MSYSIKYLSAGTKKYESPKAPKRQYKAYIIAAIIFLVGTYFLLSHGQPPLLSFLLPGADAYTGEAIHAMVESIRSGEPVTDAITAFCTDIIANAK